MQLSLRLRILLLPRRNGTPGTAERGLGEGVELGGASPWQSLPGNVAKNNAKNIYANRCSSRRR